MMDNGPMQPQGLFRLDRKTFGLILALALIVAAVFSRGLTTQFIELDDGNYVFDNPHVRTGLSAENLDWAFRIDYKTGFWIPLTFISLQIDAALSGPGTVPVADPAHRLPGSPPPFPIATVYKIHNLLLHMAAAVMLFLFCYRATKLRFASFVLALLWAIHPLRVESVVWVTERKDVLAGAWGFLAMFLYVGWRERGGWVRYGGVAIAFTLSLMAKPMFITLPAIFVLLDAWPLERISGIKDIFKSLAGQWVFILLSIADSIPTSKGQTEVKLSELGILPRVETAVTGYVAYVMRQIRVWDLSLYYPYNEHISEFEVIGAMLFLAVVTWICIVQRRVRPWLLMGWLWFLGSLVPMIGLVQVGFQAYADRFSYLPAVGLFIMVVFTVRQLILSHPTWKRPAAIGTVAAMVFFGCFSFIQQLYWKDSISILTRTVEVTSNNYIIYNTLSNSFLREGENDFAINSLIKSVQAFPKYDNSWVNLGYLNYKLGNDEKAAWALNHALQIDASDPRVWFVYGVALYGAKHLDLAIAAFNETLRLDSSNALAEKNLRMATEDKAAMEEHLRQQQLQQQNNGKP